MTYIRKMRPERSALGVKDGSEKVYYTWEEVNNSLKKRINEDAEELRLKFRKYKLKEKNIGFSKKLSYV